MGSCLGAVILLIVGIAVQVFEYTGQLVAQVDSDRDVRAVCAAAASQPAHYPLLAGVDQYDDTTFNARQAVMLIAELDRLAAAFPELREEVAPLRAAAQLLEPAPRRPHHRRLIFNGD